MAYLSHSGNTYRYQGFGTPTDSEDAVNKAYADMLYNMALDSDLTYTFSDSGSGFQVVGTRDGTQVTSYTYTPQAIHVGHFDSERLLQHGDTWVDSDIYLATASAITARVNALIAAAPDDSITYTLTYDSGTRVVSLNPSSGSASTFTLPTDMDTTYTASFNNSNRNLTLTPTSGTVQTVNIPDSDHTYQFSSPGGDTLRVHDVLEDTDFFWEPSNLNVNNFASGVVVGTDFPIRGTSVPTTFAVESYVNDRLDSDVIAGHGLDATRRSGVVGVQTHQVTFSVDTDIIADTDWVRTYVADHVTINSLDSDEVLELIAENADAWVDTDMTRITTIFSADNQIRIQAGSFLSGSYNDTEDATAVSRVIIRADSDSLMFHALDHAVVGSPIQIGTGVNTVAGLVSSITKSGNMFTLGIGSTFEEYGSFTGSTVIVRVRPTVTSPVVANDLFDYTVSRRKLQSNVIRPWHMDESSGAPVNGSIPVATGAAESNEWIWRRYPFTDSGTTLSLDTGWHIQAPDSDFTGFHDRNFITRAFGDHAYFPFVQFVANFDTENLSPNLAETIVHRSQYTGAAATFVVNGEFGWVSSINTSTGEPNLNTFINETPDTWQAIADSDAFANFVFSPDTDWSQSAWYYMFTGRNGVPGQFWFYGNEDNWAVYSVPHSGLFGDFTNAGNVNYTSVTNQSQNYRLQLLASRGRPTATMRVGTNSNASTREIVDLTPVAQEPNWFLGADKQFHDGNEFWGRVEDVRANDERITDLDDRLIAGWGTFPRTHLDSDVYAPRDFTSLTADSDFFNFHYLEKDQAQWQGFVTQINQLWHRNGNYRDAARIAFDFREYNASGENFTSYTASVLFRADSGTAAAVIDTDGNRVRIRWAKPATLSNSVIIFRDGSTTRLTNAQLLALAINPGFFSNIQIYDNREVGNGLIFSNSDFSTIGNPHFRYGDNHDDKILFTRDDGITAANIAGGVSFDSDRNTLSFFQLMGRGPTDTESYVVRDIRVDGGLLGSSLDTDTGVFNLRETFQGIYDPNRTIYNPGAMVEANGDMFVRGSTPLQNASGVGPFNINGWTRIIRGSLINPADVRGATIRVDNNGVTTSLTRNSNGSINQVFRNVQSGLTTEAWRKTFTYTTDAVPRVQYIDYALRVGGAGGTYSNVARKAFARDDDGNFSGVVVSDIST